jgi:hypothetical protein
VRVDDAYASRRGGGSASLGVLAQPTILAAVRTMASGEWITRAEARRLACENGWDFSEDG